MSLEAKIELLTEAVTRLIDALNAQQTVIVAPSAPAPQAQSVPTQAVPTVAAPVSTTVQAVAATTKTAVNGTQVEMPAPPSFEAPQPAAANVGAPFTDGKGLIDYVMGAYKQMGAEKGAKIQNVLMSLNYSNINDVKPEHYGALFQGIEALKG